MASGREQAAPDGAKPARTANGGEHWWPVALAILATGILHVALPAQYRVNPKWLTPVVILTLLATLIIGDPGRIDRQRPWLRAITGLVIAFITLANLFAAGSSTTSSPTTRSSRTTPPGCWLPAG